MFAEFVICDDCGTQVALRGSVLPVSWLARDGMQFCSQQCRDAELLVGAE